MIFSIRISTYPVTSRDFATGLIRREINFVFGISPFPFPKWLQNINFVRLTGELPEPGHRDGWLPKIAKSQIAHPKSHDRHSFEI
jgi:hypothetical protein